MLDLTDDQWRMLFNLASRDGIGPDRPYLTPDGRALMRLGLIELVDPPRVPGRSKSLPFARLTDAGWKVAAERPATTKA